MTKKISIPEELDARNAEIKKNVLKKGFYLYEWISFSELRQTLQKDYLKLLSQILLPFGCLVVTMGILDIYVYQAGFKLFIGFMVLCYLLLFLLLIYRLLRRSWIFLKINKVVFTDTHIGIGANLTPYSEYNSIKGEIEKWGMEFEEILMQTSNLSDKIMEFKVKVLSWGSKKNPNSDRFKLDSFDPQLIRGLFDSNDSREIGFLIIFVFIILSLIFTYWISLRIFYYIGWLFALFIGFISIGIMKLIILIKGDEARKINELFEDLETISSSIAQGKKMILENMGSFKETYSKEYSNKIDDGFTSLSARAMKGTGMYIKLKGMLENSKYKDIFNFLTFNLWIRTELLEPINEMIDIIETNIDIIFKSIRSIESQIKTTPDKNNKASLEISKKRLEMQYESMAVNKKQWLGLASKIII